MLIGLMSPEVEKLVSAGKLSHADGEKLSKLAPGSFCLHKSWGAGRVAEWDLLGDRMIIDFEDKAGHPMKLSFAVSSLESLPEDHLLARRVGELPSLKALAKKDPVAMVTTVLRGFGNKMALDALEGFLVPKVMSAAEYKSWWTAAKKLLKDKRHITVPAKKAEFLVLREQEGSAAAAMLQELKEARDLKSKLAVTSRIIKDLDLVDDAAELAPVFKEITDTVRKSWRLNLRDSLHLLVARDEIHEAANAPALSEGELTLVELMRENRAQLADAVGALPAAYLGRLYRAFPEAFPERGWVIELLNHLTRTGGRAVAEIASVFDANDELDVLAEFLKKAVRNRQLSTDLLIWMCKERKGRAESVFDIDLGNAIVGALEDDYIAGGPKRTGRLSDAFTEDLGLLPEMVGDADTDEVRLFAKRIITTSVFDELTRRSLMGRIIKTRPEMQELMDEGAKVEQTALVVSWESMERRKLELEDLVKVKIPQNKKDIQIAREYGDLRENFEYKSARQQQAVLLRLQSKYERELRNARGTDFAGVNADSVAMGTIVDLEDVASGDMETQTILGAWDGDPDKSILSYLSEMAKAIIGKKVGEEAEVPTDTQGTRRVRIKTIRAYHG